MDTVIDPEEVASRFGITPKTLAIVCYRLACTLTPDMEWSDRLALRGSWLRIFCALDPDTQQELIAETRDKPEVPY
jgi:hypothetical protein